MRIRLTKQCCTAYYDEPLSEIRFHHTGLSNSEVNEHLKALGYIYRKSKPLLNDLSPSERKDVQQKLGEWISFIALRTTTQELKARHRGLALRHYLNYLRYSPNKSLDSAICVQLILPRPIYLRLREMYRRAHIAAGTGNQQ